MIISHKYKYIFIEFPQTGCSAVGRELMENYDGKRILFKHAQLHEFLKSATKEEKDYFTFSTVRNPMDVIVSKYFKFKTNHENYSTKKVKHGKIRKLVMPGYEGKRRDYIVNSDAEFEDYFLKFYRWPYSAWSILSHHKLDYLMRFENLADDFANVLAALKIDPVRQLPVFNKTGEKRKAFHEYYSSPETKIRAINVFGPYMNEWGYTFPEEWKEELKTASPKEGAYSFVNVFRKFYWRYLR